jgi:2-acylglycerol O-acyltransferase 2
MGRKPKHLYILPGGIAEIFVSTPGKHAIIFKHRKGLIRLAIETGVNLVPCYVFGGTDFFENLATGQGWLSRMSRKFRMGLTIFWGHFGLPIPYAPRVTMCLAEPIDIPKWTGEGKIPQELIDETHAKVSLDVN